jgi:hypothetical protein
MTAMAVRGVLPPGFMLSPAAHGVSVRLCSGATMVVDLGKSEHGKQRSDTAPCAFAAIAHAAPAPSAVSVPIATAPAIAVTAHTPTRVGQGLAAPPPPATGPPLHA